MSELMTVDSPNVVAPTLPSTNPGVGLVSSRYQLDANKAPSPSLGVSVPPRPSGQSANSMSHSPLVNGTSLATASPTDSQPDTEDLPLTLSTALRKKTGGRNPRDMLTEKLSLAKGHHSPALNRSHGGSGACGPASRRSPCAADLSMPTEDGVFGHPTMSTMTTRVIATSRSSSTVGAPRRHPALVQRRSTGTGSPAMMTASAPTTHHPVTTFAHGSPQSQSSAYGSAGYGSTDVCGDNTPMLAFGQPQHMIGEHMDRPTSSWRSQTAASDSSLHDLSDVAATHGSPFTGSAMEAVLQQPPTTSTAEVKHDRTCTSHMLTPFVAAPTRPKARKSNGDRPGGQICFLVDDPVKPCRQRAILGFKYCIRHILLDKNAPYKPCAHKKKQKRKGDDDIFCSNPVRATEKMPYCSTHLILLGMKEPKRKPGSAPIERPAAKATTEQLLESMEHNPLLMNSQPMPRHLQQPRPAAQQAQPFENGQPSEWAAQSTSQNGFFSEGTSTYNAADGQFYQPPFANGASLNGGTVLNNLASPLPSPAQQQPSVPPQNQTAPQSGGVYTQQQFVGENSEQTAWIANGHDSTQYHQMQPRTPHNGQAFSPPATQGTFIPAARSTPGSQGRPDSSYGTQQQSAQQTRQWESTTQRGVVRVVNAEPISHNYPELSSKLNARPQNGPMVMSSPMKPGTVMMDASQPQQFFRPAVGAQPVQMGQQWPQQAGLVSHLERSANALQHRIVQGTSGQHLVQVVHQQAPQPVLQMQQVVHVRQTMPTPQQQALHQYYTGGAQGSTPLPFPYTSATSSHGQGHGIVTSDVKEDGTRVIRLRQKRQRLRMVGRYRHIPAVNHVCKVLEDNDFDRSDLFPLGLEPSDSDTESEEDEIGVGSMMAERCFTSRILLAANDRFARRASTMSSSSLKTETLSAPSAHSLNQSMHATLHEHDVKANTFWSPTDDDGPMSGNGSSPRIQLYLLKKQLRLERYSLLREARMNASVMPTARKFPNSVGRALIDQADRGRTRHSLKWTRLRRSVKYTCATRLNGSTDRSQLLRRQTRVVYAQVPKWCKRTGCGQRRLPYCNFCGEHARTSSDQQPFRICSFMSCDLAVLDLGLDLTQANGSRCQEHIGVDEQALMAQAGAGQQKRYPSQRPKKRRRPQKSGSLLQKKLTSSSEEFDDDDDDEEDDSPLGHHMISGSPLKDCRGDHDVSLASVAKDLLMEGFDDDPELSDMLGLAVDEFSSIMGHDELAGKAGMFTSPPSCPPGMYGEGPSTSTGGYAVEDGASGGQHDATHSWDDVDAFLKSEGYQSDRGLLRQSFEPPMGMHNDALLHNMQQPTSRPPPPPYNASSASAPTTPATWTQLMPTTTTAPQPP